MEQYDAPAIEAKWQDRWDAEKRFAADNVSEKLFADIICREALFRIPPVLPFCLDGRGVILLHWSVPE